MIAFRVLRDGQVELALRSTELRVQQSVREFVTRSALKVQAHVVRSKISGPRTGPIGAQVLRRQLGTLRASINNRVIETPTRVTGTVGTNIRYAAVHEYGYEGPVTLREHIRTVKQAFGKRLKTPVQATVRAHSRRNVKIPERSFLRSALRDLQQDIRKDALVSTAKAIRGVS